MDRAMEDVESYCSSDDEVYYGPITMKEIKKTLKLRRRTKIHRAASEYVTQFHENCFIVINLWTHTLLSSVVLCT
jgi:hypothetical protein